MDWTVYPKTRIARLPKPLRLPALLARELSRRSPEYVYEADGLATAHFSPFLEDQEFERLYWVVEREWFPEWHADLRWRAWILTRLALQAGRLPGDFAEFGVYRGGYAKLILSLLDIAPPRRFHLFDTFSGIPDEDLTPSEQQRSFAGRYDDTSTDHVENFLSAWQEVISIHDGDVRETLDGVETGPLAFVHFDLNASAPTQLALEYVAPRVLPGAVLVFDDYGWSEYRDQRSVIEAFAESSGQPVIAMPTGQAFWIAPPS